MNALILDTETHDMNGYPIEIAHVPCDFNKLGVLQIVDDLLFDKFYSCPEPISFGAMAVHHIIGFVSYFCFSTFNGSKPSQYAFYVCRRFNEE